MEIIKKLSEIYNYIPSGKKVGITIGNFDGVHLGHQKLIGDILKDCCKRDLQLVLITFVPHPHQILKTRSAHFLLSSYLERRKLLENCGVKFMIEIEFTRDFSTMGAQEFLDKFIFLKEIDLGHFYLGHDFAFGKGKEGDFAFINEYCRKTKIPVSGIDEYRSNGNIVSSSKIRYFISLGDMENANNYLGRNYSLKGLVIKGKGRGGDLGVATANISTSSAVLLPLAGVYIGQTKIDNKRYNSITNVGFNPTFDELKTIKIETNIFDFSQDIYGKEIEVSFLKRLRDEQKFDNSQKLMLQIEDDIKKAQEFFK